MIELKKSPVVFNEDEHRYFLGEKELRGVTSTLIKRAFPDKYKDVDPDVLAKAAEKGHQLHSAIEFFDNFKGAAEDAGDDRIIAYANLKKEKGLTTIANEYLVSDEENYASSVDIVMQNEQEEIILVDTKTTWNLDKRSTGLQLSIYKRWFERQNPDLKVSHIYVLWLPNKDHSICEFTELAVVADDTIDTLIDADQNDEPFEFDLIPDEWASLEREYRYWLTTKEMADQRLDLIKQRMMDVMESSNIQSVKTDIFTVSYIAAKKGKRFDSALFKKENKDVYESYMKDVETATQIRVTPKKQEQ